LGANEIKYCFEVNNRFLSIIIKDFWWFIGFLAEFYGFFGMFLLGFLAVV
jgi:hypothetical protein